MHHFVKKNSGPEKLFSKEIVHVLFFMLIRSKIEQVCRLMH